VYHVGHGDEARASKATMTEHRPRLLVCDDSAAHRRILQSMLGPTYEFLLVDSGEEALLRAPAFAPDLIISDLIMGGIDGYEVIRRAHVEPALRHVPIILVTSKTDDDSRMAGLEVGADDYLFKPVRKRELVARVTSLLRLRQATLELEQRTAELEEANRILQKAQADLVRSEKLASLGQLVAGIAHELNNPLNYIYGNTAFLADYSTALLRLIEQLAGMPDLTPAQAEAVAAWKRDADYDYVREDIGKIVDGVRIGAERAAEIVRGLRTFARVEAGVIELESVDLAKLADMALTVLRHELRDRIKVHRDYKPMPLCRCDGGRVTHVLMNLFMNAIQAIDGPGDIRVVLEAQGSEAVFTVSDTGCGMNAEVRARIFDPFFTTKPVGKGTGLGLSISYGIVEQHHGRIEVVSEPGRGASFTVRLPLGGPPEGTPPGGAGG
jgi:two-component system, NtrC family, sensor kinase